MIWLYTGTPGSGKSYHAAKDIINKLNCKKNNKVIANFEIYFNKNKKKDLKMLKNFTYIDTFDLSVDFLKKYAFENHKIGVENQTLVVIDEAHFIFNSRDWNSKNSNRMDWIKFFSQHRKFGYSFILISQFDRMLDRQIRSLVEYEVAHLKLRNVFKLFPFPCFLAIIRWYGQNLKIGTDLIIFKKKISNYYNSFKSFDNEDYLSEVLNKNADDNQVVN